MTVLTTTLPCYPLIDIVCVEVDICTEIILNTKNSHLDFPPLFCVFLPFLAHTKLHRASHKDSPGNCCMQLSGPYT